LDALIIAATTREHTRYLNTLSAADTDEDFRRYRLTLVKGKIREFKEPWNNFTKDAKAELGKTVVTFKSSSNIISQPKNRFIKWAAENGVPVKKSIEQRPNPRWMAVRRSMFKEPQGVVYLKEVYEEKNILKVFEIQIARMLTQNTPAMRLASYVYDHEARKLMRDIIDKTGISIQEKSALLNELKKYLKKNPLTDLSGNEYQSIRIAEFQEYAAKRVVLDKSFDHKKIDKIPYARIGKSVIGTLLHNHLNTEEYEGKSELAFSGEGLESLAKKAGRPITKVTITEKKDENSKFGNQYVEVDAGAMAYFIMYENQTTKERTGYYSIPVHKAIERLTNKTQSEIADEKEGYNLIILSPNDLVYVPTEEEWHKIKTGEHSAIDWDDKKKIAERVYKMNSCTGSKCEFVPHRYVNQNPIIDKIEFGANNINQRAWDGKVELISNKKDGFTREDSGTMIKDVCIKLKVDRLGNILPEKKKNYDEPPAQQNILSEPEAPYKSKSLSSFTSFEDMENDQLNYFASLQPEQLLQNLRQMVLAAFGFKEEPSLNSLPRTINFNTES
jgi:CRISPR-associated endonuclease Csn1